MAYLTEHLGEQFGFNDSLMFSSPFDFLVPDIKPGFDVMIESLAASSQTITIYSPITSFELGGLDGSNGFFINGITEGGRLGGEVSNAGDINGDGFDDFIIGASSGFANGLYNAGQVYIVFGSSGFQAQAGNNIEFDLEALDGSNGFSITGLGGLNALGVSISGIGDFNGDGIDDFIVGAPGVANQSGDSYVIFGTRDGYDAEFDLTSLDGTNGFVLYGDAARDGSGSAVSNAGDVNGDGFADIIVGARGVDGVGENSGEAYVVFGSASGVFPNLYLNGLDGTNGFIISSPTAGVELGLSVSSAGDFNGDGFDDILVSAPGIEPDENLPTGETYIIFGSGSGFSSHVDLANLSSSEGLTIFGLRGNGFRGQFDGNGLSVSGVGDINGDGLDDILIGAPNSGTYNGEAYIVFGSATRLGGYDLNNLDGHNGFQITGTLSTGQLGAGPNAGTSVSGAGDVNGDGYDDFLIGAPDGAFASSPSGDTYLIFGSASGHDGRLDLANIDGSIGFIIEGRNIGDQSGSSVSSAGDINGDGFDDILIGASGSSEAGPNDYGQSYIIYGTAEFGRDTTTLTDGNDAFSVRGRGTVVYAGDGDDITDGLGGSDYLYGEGGNDDMFGGADNDMLDGGLGDDILNGGTGNDTLIGGEGFDILIGAAGEDELNGGAGHDYITGGIGNDELRGGAGEDTFVIMSGAGNDVIHDFEIGVDWIEFGDDVYKFDQLSFIQVGDDVQIKSANGVTTLIGINVADINQYDFIFRTTSDGPGTKKGDGKSVVSGTAPEIELPEITADEVAELLRAIEVPQERDLEAHDFESADIMFPWQLGDFEQIA